MEFNVLTTISILVVALAGLIFFHLSLIYSILPITFEWLVTFMTMLGILLITAIIILLVVDLQISDGESGGGDV